ncbi:Lrp/AsnC family leucine-responsive transcriptional regulator [Rhizobium leguminosarum]|uniref:Lrp/AsnC family leucine-responsive transcriptional regulator n=6 Tax=Hyphomicrobiales TaxID=356 RepID=A0A7W6USB8_9HYPH|nr:Lrp/AsnC family leucine-responsive transcriptional regulator [Rhizobium esperanzae]MDH6202898.1 Lrp/AsnC family leucine-responsive transcriptional regulator [Rhizobium leguminosarum]
MLSNFALKAFFIGVIFRQENPILQLYEVKMQESPTEDFDRIDLKILRALQLEGRLSNADLAERVNVSAATCHRRTQRLFDKGYITGVRAEVAPGAVGLGAMVMVGVVLDRSTPESFGAFEGAVMELKEVLDCNLVAGDFDYLLKIRVRDMADFNKLHGQKLIALPGVRQTRTFFVMKEVKENARLPF